MRPGFFIGTNLNLLGDYNQCIESSKADDAGSYGVQYCLTALELNHDSTEAFSRMSNISLVKTTNLNLKLGLCLPKSCSEVDILNVLRSILESSQITEVIQSQSVQCQASDTKFSYINIGLIAALLVIGSSLGLCFFATFFKQTSSNRSLIRFFNLRQNFKIFLSRHDSSSKFASELYLDTKPLDGLRAISMIILIIHHSYTFADMLLSYDNLQNSQNRYTTLLSQFILNSTFMVNNFMLISAC